MTRWAWIFLTGLFLWMGIGIGQYVTVQRFNNEIERLATENSELLSHKRHLRACIGRLEAEVVILKRKVGKK